MYDATYKVVIVGDEGVGKKTLGQNFLNSLFREEEVYRVYIPFVGPVNMKNHEIGVNFRVKSLEINEIKIKLQFYILKAEERFRFLLPTYTRGANGALFMYDVTSYSTLTHIDDWLQILRKEIKSEQDTFPIIVVGNKADLLDEREVTGDEGIRIAKSRGLDGFIECSVKTGENVEETFDALARLMMMKSNLL